MFFEGEKNSVELGVCGVNVPLVADVEDVVERAGADVGELVELAGADVVVRAVVEVVELVWGDPLEQDANTTAPATRATRGTARRRRERLSILRA